ncbi:PREDICTED: homeobox-leucine zipper protein HAT5 [Nelumbo nucifera]|uniref:Homeobox-leucine zipper protein HAT5 n=1 Tax=Nelumbo nucifera TaxID=4432 RepID=A0A1U8Q9W8_NELNU|nr:PREDICTED: homeobox-leucine zipper protein HAT5 [Nelumbo nucifera]
MRSIPEKFKTNPSAIHQNSTAGMGGMRSMLNMEENPRRQPFFPLADDLIDEEFYDEQLPEKETTAHSKAGFSSAQLLLPIQERQCVLPSNIFKWNHDWFVFY